ncbi:MAG: hypothetical protein JSR25_09820 [Proteobacteria bacterium]|nr:hypothetical protein [Pseudomonadota bacterium]
MDAARGWSRGAGVIYQRIFQVVGGGLCAFMIWGGGFFWTESLPNNFTRTNTYTLYSKLPPPPDGPAFCSRALFGQYGVVMPCNFEPPFLWWLLRKAG